MRLKNLVGNEKQDPSLTLRMTKKQNYDPVCESEPKPKAKMIRILRNKKAQSILEYAVLLGLAGIALSTMQVYFKRGIQSVIKVAADEVGGQKGSEEFDPIKGSKSDSKVRRVVSGAPAATADLAQGVTERQVVSADGNRIRYIYSVSEVQPHEDGTKSYSTYITRRD